MQALNNLRDRFESEAYHRLLFSVSIRWTFMLIYCGRYLAYQTFVDAVSNQSLLEKDSVTWAPGYGFPSGEKSMIIYCQGLGNQGGPGAGFEDAIAVSGLPEKFCKRLRTVNMP